VARPLAPGGAARDRRALLGRDDERLALDRLLAEARDGRSGVLAFVGEPGIGKTALLEYAAARATGMQVVRARGIESEAEVPFAGLAELLAAATAYLDRIPARQAEALSGALALGPPAATGRFAVGAATLSLLSAFAEEAPLALLVDDAHLLDGSSAAALLFAARRLVADPIALVLAVREGEPSLLDGADLRVLRVPGLDRHDASLLLEHEAIRGETLDRLYRATAGNPLALLELAPEGARLTALPGEAPLPISARIAGAFVRRLERLPAPTRGLLVVAAASGAGDMAVIAGAAHELGLDLGSLAPAEESGLVTLDDHRLAFSHPLVRSAIYAGAPAEERRRAHAALAAALPQDDGDRRAWHLAAASLGPDEAASEALARAGERALGRSAYAVAAAAFDRGARLSPAGAARAPLLVAAADAAWLAGDPERTIALLDEAAPRAADAGLTARVDNLRAHVAIRRGPVPEGCALMVATAARVAGTDPELAVVMLAEAVLGRAYSGDTAGMVAAAEQAVGIAAGGGSTRARFFAAMAQGMALVAAGDGRGGAAAIRQAVKLLARPDELGDDPRLLPWIMFGPLWLREAEAGRAMIDSAVERARTEAAVGVLPTLLQHIARDEATTDRWQSATASYDEAIRLARETGQRTELGAALAGLALLEARRGRTDECRAHAAEAAALCAELDTALYASWALQALGDLELGLGRPAEALSHYEAKASKLRAHAIADVDVSPAPELVDAYLRLGRDVDAAAVSGPYTAAAEAKGQPWALARALRCRALLAGDASEADALFEEALRLHELTPDGFEGAVTRLARGARLRRAQKRVRAREELRAALAVFEPLGARPWADQVVAELAASGETARRRHPSTIDDLTPQELQIARLLGEEGRTTREAAAALFLSPKTIEYHLRHVYLKLGIHSRDELAAALASPG
jgi:DNA-binding CsgD family transcriptional regulator